MPNKRKNNRFSIQADESTDFSNKCHGVVFAIFVNDGEIQENFTATKNNCLKQANKTSILNVLSLYQDTESPSWRNSAGGCIDGAPSVVGYVRAVYMSKFGGLAEESSPQMFQYKG